MTLRELRYLVALADRAHFGRAAEDCHISQPTLSTQIRKLEEYLGVTLIERNAKSISLTPIGQEVARKARQIVSQVDDLLFEVGDFLVDLLSDQPIDGLRGQGPRFSVVSTHTRAGRGKIADGRLNA